MLPFGAEPSAFWSAVEKPKNQNKEHYSVASGNRHFEVKPLRQ
jgi:hypothetical protein